MGLIDKLTQMDGSKEELTSNLQRKYSILIKAGEINELNQLVRQTKVVPILSDEELKKLYISKAEDYVSHYGLEQIVEWDKKAHKGKPIVFRGLGDDFANALQEGYFTLIRNDRVDKENFNAIKKLTGIAVSEETVNRGLNERIRDRNISQHYPKIVEEATGIKPEIDEKVVQEVYTRCLGKDKYNNELLYYWEYLFKVTKIKPEEKTAQKAFRKLVSDNQAYDLARYAELVGVTPDEKTVKKAYRVLAKKGSNFTEYYNELKKISKGVEPDENIVQLAYKRILEDTRESIWDHYFVSVKKLTGINPKEGLLQQAYAKCIKDGEFETYENLYDAFKIEPSAKVKKELAKYLGS